METKKKEPNVKVILSIPEEKIAIKADSTSYQVWNGNHVSYFGDVSHALSEVLEIKVKKILVSGQKKTFEELVANLDKALKEVNNFLDPILKVPTRIKTVDIKEE